MTNVLPREGLLDLTLDASVANEIGVQEAVMLNHINWWCTKNRENKSQRHLHEGVYWTYYSKSDLAEFFGFWTEAQIRRILDKLISRNYIRKGCFNRKGYDKTCWYTPGHRCLTLTDMSTSLDEPNDT